VRRVLLLLWSVTLLRLLLLLRVVVKEEDPMVGLEFSGVVVAAGLEFCDVVLNNDDAKYARKEAHESVVGLEFCR
ncbi:hypothetical protein A2U01_0009152, partial [Trifolium medium]|nr:hypothetical protein [Trifolium medium]